MTSIKLICTNDRNFREGTVKCKEITLSTNTIDGKALQPVTQPQKEGQSPSGIRAAGLNITLVGDDADGCDIHLDDIVTISIDTDSKTLSATSPEASAQ